jgi:hypothetical protein
MLASDMAQFIHHLNTPVQSHTISIQAIHTMTRQVPHRTTISWNTVTGMSDKFRLGDTLWFDI